MLVLVRHGESKWNKLDLFTGFRDVDLTSNGAKEASKCGISLRQYNFDVAFTSNLMRAYKTCGYITSYSKIPIKTFKSDNLNERDYGNLTGKNKKEMAEQYGEKQVQLWRRSIDVRPPGGENLIDVIKRVEEYYETDIRHYLDNGDNVLVVAHGNSLRALLVVLGIFSEDIICNFEIPTGKPMFIDTDTKKYWFENEYKLKGMEILDSRGNPTLQTVMMDDSNNIIGKGSAPSGASTGSNEAMELRDENPDLFCGKGVLKACTNIDGLNKLLYLDDKTILNSVKCDNQLIFTDGTPFKTNLGGNVTTACSYLFANVGANLCKKSLFKYFKDMYGYKFDKFSLPVPMVNILNGGKHAGGNLKIQEFMIVPSKKFSFYERTNKVCIVYNKLKTLLKEKYGPSSINVGDEGGFAPNLNTPHEALNIIESAIEECGLELGKDMMLALDCASSEFYDKETKLYEIEKDHKISTTQLVEYYMNLIKAHPALISIEDPFDEKDYDGWRQFCEMCGDKIMIVGDDLFTTNPTIIKDGLEQKWANSLLLKVNQIGTITEAVKAAKLMQDNNCKVIVSHRSGETNSSLISDLAVGINAEYIKLGAPARGERVEKYNRLLEIEKELNLV